tara:strand:- start:318 stop:1223 length:906 start_codon:yes stop_codon:yes gene_type:complete
MPYLGNKQAETYSSFIKEDKTGTAVSAGASITLAHSVANENELRVVINHVIQEPTTSFTASGTSLTILNDAILSTDDWYIVYLGRALGTVNPPDGSVGSAQIASSAVDLTSNKVTGVLPVANGGSGSASQTGLVLLLNATIGNVSEYVVTNSIISTAYNNYKIYLYAKPVTDDKYLYIRAMNGGSSDNGSNYSRDTDSRGGNFNSQGTTTMALPSYWTAGNQDGEGISMVFDLMNCNYANFPATISGIANTYSTDGVAHLQSIFSGGYTVANRAKVVEGLNIFWASGNIAEGTIKVYGVAE